MSLEPITHIKRQPAAFGRSSSRREWDLMYLTPCPLANRKGTLAHPTTSIN
jgi:hypothetical protein